MKKIGILASYNGSGFETIQNAILNGVLNAEVCVVITNNTNAGVLEKANRYGVDSFVINSKFYPDENLDLKITKILKEYKCDYIFLSGFMKKIKKNLLENVKKEIKIYPCQSIKIHILKLNLCVKFVIQSIFKPQMFICVVQDQVVLVVVMTLYQEN